MQMKLYTDSSDQVRCPLCNCSCPATLLHMLGSCRSPGCSIRWQAKQNWGGYIQPACFGC